MLKNKLIKQASVVLFVSLFFLLGGLIGRVNAASVTTAPSASISVDTTTAGGTSSFTAMGEIIITEDASGDIAIGNHVFTLPTEWEFATSTGTINATVSGAGELAVTSPITANDGQSFTVSVTAISTTGTNILTISGLQVRPTITTSGISHEIFHDSGSASIVGIVDNNTSFGTVSTIPGTVSQLAITNEPTNTVYGDFINTIVVNAQDQFGNNSDISLDATENVTVTINTGAGVLSGDMVKNIGTGSSTPGVVQFSDLKIDSVGEFTLQVDSASYTADISTVFDITPKELTVSGAVANDKVYDDSTAAIIAITSLEGIINDDDVTIDSYAGLFANKNVASSTNVTANLTITGTKTANYTLTQPTGLTADINPASLTVTAPQVTKIYNGNTDVIETESSIEGLVGNNVAGNIATLTYNTKTVGNDKVVSPSGLIIHNTSSDSTDVSANYYINYVSNNASVINTKTLSLDTLTAQNKAYDGAVEAYGIVTSALVGVEDGDFVSIASATSEFDDKNVGEGKTVTVTFNLDGADSDNYNLGPLTTSANITSKVLTIENAVAQDIVYNGATVTEVVGATLIGVIDDEDVSLSGHNSGFFSDRIVGDDVVVTMSGATIIGDDISNYSLERPTYLTASILPKELTVINAEVVEKRYDGNRNATIVGAELSGVVTPLAPKGTSDTEDDVSLNNHTTGTFVSAQSGSNIAVETEMTIVGTDAGNYTLTQPTLTGTIKAVSSGIIGSSINFCSSVGYSSWGDCVGGIQHRDILSKSASGCTLTTEQQLAAQRVCVVFDNTDSEQEGDEIQKKKGEEFIGDNKESDLDVDEVMNRERSMVKSVNRILSQRLSGRILLQVEEGGQAWYVDANTNSRHFMGRPNDAFELMRKFGLGVSEDNYYRFRDEGIPSRFAGQILLRVERNGEAYYVNPETLEMHYLGRPADAFSLMRELALGISNENIRQIGVGK